MNLLTWMRSVSTEEKEEVKAQLLEWIEAKRLDAQKSLNESEKAREESDYTDIDALDKSCFNSGVISMLDELHEFIFGDSSASLQGQDAGNSAPTTS